jgi:hypothetical protein
VSGARDGQAARYWLIHRASLQSLLWYVANRTTLGLNATPRTDAMADHNDRNLPDEPEWLDEFRDLADRELGAGSSCEQVHPVVARWYHDLLESEPPPSRDSVLQAMACLSSEILAEAPPTFINEETGQIDEDQLAGWVEYILMVGRAFEIGLRNGALDDL